MRLGLKDQVQTPCIVHDGLQTANAFEFDFVVRLPFLFAALQQLYDCVDTILAEFPDPTDRVAGQSDAE